MKNIIRFDWAIKNILRNKANFSVLEGFLKALLKDSIKIISILESESNMDNELDKFNRVDLKCMDSSGKIIIIEIQNQNHQDFYYRILYGSSKAIVESIELGDKYNKIAKIISISIIHHSLATPSELRNIDFIYHGVTELVGYHTKEPLFIKDFRVKESFAPYYTSRSIFPEYFIIFAQKFDDVVNEELDEWIYFFKNGDVLDTFKSESIKLAANKLNVLKLTKEEREKYENYLYHLPTVEDSYETATREGYDRGKREGYSEGKNDGYSEGKNEGYLAGKSEGIDEGIRMVIKKMIKNNIPADVIALSTGVSIDEILRLYEEW